MQTPRTEFAQALKAIAQERGLDPSVILETIKEAIVAAYKRDAREQGEDVEEQVFTVQIDPKDGGAKVFQDKKDVTPPGFGRIAAQTAKQVIHQKIREAEKGAIMDEFSGRVGTLISGMVLRFDGPDVKIDIGRTEAIMPASERIPNERLSLNQRLSFLLKEIKEGLRGKDIILSRADPLFVEKLFAREVPEIASGNVTVKQIAREAGVRTKIAVVSSQQGVDPVGSCVGQKGVRVQAVTNELGGERVDLISYSEDLAELVKASLSPADGLTVKVSKKDKLAKVMAPDDQLSLAIGKDGQNVRLAAKLTGLRIEVEGTGENLNPEIPEVKKEVVEEKKEEVAPETLKEEPKVEIKEEVKEVEKKEESPKVEEAPKEDSK
jgi:transcription termination/antitermination protein NusA